MTERKAQANWRAGHCGFNRLGCSFYCEDHVQFPIFIRSSERKAQANWRAGHCGFNLLGCSFYCEDHVQFHIFIRSSNHFIYFNTRIFLYQLLFSLVISSFVFKNLLLFVLSASSESVDGMVKALWTFRRTQASLSIKEGKSALQVKCSLNRHVTFSLASHPNRDPPL